MADIELVIKVDERDVELVRKKFKPTGYSFIPTCIQTEFVSAILNGTPLPKEHGRLIDADALDLEREVDMADDWKTAHEIANCVKYAPTILEADKAESEDKE